MSQQGVTPYPGTSTAAQTQTPSLAIALADPSESLRFTAGQSVQIGFTVTGADASTVIVGLTDTPSPSATLSVNGASVSFAWAAPAAGQYQIRFLLRDLPQCLSANGGDESKCDISPSQYGNLPQSAYDTVSSFTAFEVDASTLANPGTTTGATSSGGSNVLGSLGSLGNGQIINQIVSLVPGAGRLTGLLSTLSGGQLSSLLGQAQGGNLGVGNILAGFGNGSLGNGSGSNFISTTPGASSSSNP